MGVNKVTSEFTLEDFINSQVLESAEEHAVRFDQAEPFRHVVLDNFLSPEFCAQICAQFPPFRDKHAINENKQIGGKATRDQVRSLGPAFKQMDQLAQNPGWLSLVGKITGIKDLQYDPCYFGGGTHENRQGQELDPHVDFNYHPVTSQHRRLNLIIYLNQGWEESWGGSLQLHRDPYLEPGQDEIISVTPLLNRCVIFETSENSWHGFERIDLPEEKQHLSRRSFALYYYTDTRPIEETAKQHSTIYVQRQLPVRYQPGMLLSESDLAHIRKLLSRRDHHLTRLYGEIQDLNETINEMKYPGSTRNAIRLDVDDIPDDISSAARMIQILRYRIRELEASTSWRITAPLRAAKRLVSGGS